MENDLFHNSKEEHLYMSSSDMQSINCSLIAFQLSPLVKKNKIKGVTGPKICQRN